jgi:perosamine synthetase
MISSEQRQTIFRNSRPETRWEGEPNLGSVYGDDEINAAVAAMREASNVTQGFGGTTIRDFEAAFAAYVGAKHAVAVNSAGPGLDMAMRYLKLEPGDEVIVPAINFVAAPLAVVGAGGQIVWGEVNPRTFQLDPIDVEKRITRRTRAIFPVHMNGLAAPLDDLIEIGMRHPHEKHGPLPVIGDAARACGAEYKGGKLGKHGLCTVFSFHTMKNMVTLGEGGMMTTDSDDVAAFFRSTRFFGMETDIWGSSFVMNKVAAAVGLVQLGKLDNFIEMRRKVAARRHELLADVAEVTLPYEPPDCRHTFYLYTCLICKEWAGEKRDKLIQMMDEQYNVRLLIANKPAYAARGFLRDCTPGQQLPLSDELGERIFCVPNHPMMSETDNEYICAALIECIELLRKM